MVHENDVLDQVLQHVGKLNSKLSLTRSIQGRKSRHFNSNSNLQVRLDLSSQQDITARTIPSARRRLQAYSTRGPERVGLHLLPST